MFDARKPVTRSPGPFWLMSSEYATVPLLKCGSKEEAESYAKRAGLNEWVVREGTDVTRSPIVASSRATLL